MAPSKTPGGSGASDKFQKQEAAKHGSGAANAPGHTEGTESQPGKAPVASDSGSTNVGVRDGTNQPGEKGISGVPVSSEPSQGGSNMGGTKN
ncbi:hypothetical protein LTR78_004574 [Recurvomyces mirabilis]|uniref:Uncharacterized protein n=1 Tax=Recurvomyces mirabilis TaxID=574656 RepID=A0AAE0WPI1_9PEZI|nr:hypothetical protein LTR78_004574 [Recurvomyces mirabilis]KAK5152932.1 hypothetical protein LTS14_008040 [Recurvomyces mirabilis]